ncbi:chromatin remodeling factor 5-1 [Diaporthe eres]|uniref:ISWI chromatin-remodeling complex ATPase ISW2 n=1 Tax=Diaporthe vaccinii TaxID=105482 RepID=A0ABR4FE93_9PEZI|nr:chromatin remodeling factor 5-1 [Diaporthe eres]
MAADTSSSVDGASPGGQPDDTPPSSPPTDSSKDETAPDENFEREEAKALERNLEAERKRKASLKRKKKAVTHAEREAKAKELDKLLKQSAAFADILRGKTNVLGRVGTALDGKTLGDHDLQMATQPECLVGGTMRDYQLEGVTWMYEVCLQGMSGILADEMGLGKTIQTIGIIGLLREQENYLGPHIIIAPLSTLSNWIAEFQKWAPSIPVLMYHGSPKERENLRKTKLFPNLDRMGKPTNRFPVVCTSYEMVIKDSSSLSRIQWEFIIVDEGHRLKNAEARLFQEICKFRSATRFLITGTPLQNNLKELWSLLHFLMPRIFTDWEAFETWFDFSDLQDEEGTEQFIEDKTKQDLVKKIHTVLQPLLLRRVKADVANYLPKKREYVLYAPMTKEQTDLYNVITNKKADTRAYLEQKVVERLTGTTNTPAASRKATPSSSRSVSVVKTEKEANGNSTGESAFSGKNAFSLLMGQPKKRGRPAKNAVKPSGNATKRKEPPTSEVSTPKSARTTENSTPAQAARGRRRKVTRRSLKLNESDDDELSDDEFEAKLAEEYAEDDEAETIGTPESSEEIERAATLELAKKEISRKKLGNDLMQLRLTCNSPHNFYDPWENAEDIDESIVTSSGKMLILDRLLPALFERGSKVLIFSQFSTQLDILWDYCAELRGWKTCRISGSVSLADRQAQIEDFNSNPDCKLFILTTRAGGQGINLASADTVILFDSDWNPQQDLQAQDRAHRIGQKRPVIVYRLATKGTVEEDLLMSADAKRRLEKLVIQKGSFKNMGQKKDLNEGVDKETLRSLLLKDGEVFKFSGDKAVISDTDLETLCDRSDAAYNRAAAGAGNAAGFKVVETGANGLVTKG